MSELDQKIAARIQEAKDKGIEAAASTVAAALGRSLDKNGDSYHYTDASFNICEGSGVTGSDGGLYWQSTTIDFMGNRVFESGGCKICIYKPGLWESAFFALVEPAKVASAEKVRVEREKKEREIAHVEAKTRKNWGL